jgi:hypothetical protein
MLMDGNGYAYVERGGLMAGCAGLPAAVALPIVRVLVEEGSTYSSSR